VSATGPREEKIERKSGYSIKRGAEGEGGVLSRVYVRSILVTTSDMAKTGQSHTVSTLGVVVSNGSPAIRTTKVDVVRRVVARIDNGGIDGLGSEVLEGTLVGAGGLAVDLDLITTEEGRDPVIWSGGEVGTTGDLDVGTGMVDGQLTSGD
jgi:hypothetical protein